jgi:hypothetical protein
MLRLTQVRRAIVITHLLDLRALDCLRAEKSQTPLIGTPQPARCNSISVITVQKGATNSARQASHFDHFGPLSCRCAHVGTDQVSVCAHVCVCACEPKCTHKHNFAGLVTTCCYCS